MKKLFQFIAIILFLTTQILAQPLLEENFDYAVGDSLTKVGWVTSSGTSNILLVTSPGLTFTDYPSVSGNAVTLAATGHDVYKTFPADSTGSIYLFSLINVQSAQTGDYFIALSSATSQTNYYARLHIKAEAAGFLMGISKNSEVSGGAVYGTTVLDFNKTYLISVKYTFNTGDATDDAISVYIVNDGELSSTEPAIPEIGPYVFAGKNDVANIGIVTIRQGNNSSAPALIVDGIRIQTSWLEISPSVISIADARVDADNNLIPDKKGDTVTVAGVVISPNYQTNNISYYIWDGTAGIDLFKSGKNTLLALGDSIRITGKIDQYNGLTEIIALHDSTIEILKNNAALPAPVRLSIEEFKANAEFHEGSLITIENVNKISGNWPTSGNATIKVANDTDTLDLYIDSDTELKGFAEPAWPQDVTGIAGQFSSSNLAGGYQLLPRYIADFATPAVIPVELLSFKSTINENNVTLKWETATETNNMGFEIFRNSEKIKFVPGFGTTAERKSYSFEDNNLNAGSYSYQLVQIDFDGTRQNVGTVEVDIKAAPNKFNLSQNYPNPFNPETMIEFSVPENGMASLKIYNTLGEEIATLFNQIAEAGKYYQVRFNASNLATGLYIAKLQFSGNLMIKKMLYLK